MASASPGSSGRRFFSSSSSKGMSQPGSDGQRRVTSASAAVEGATDEKALEFPDLGLNLELCDFLREKPETVGLAVKTLRKRLGHRSSKVQSLTLSLLEMVMKNCEGSLRVHVAQSGILHDMVKLAKKKSCPPDVKQKILELVDTWDSAFAGESSQVSQYHSAFTELLAAGCVFPERSVQPPFHTPPPHNPPATLDSPSQDTVPSPFYAEALAIANQAKAGSRSSRSRSSRMRLEEIQEDTPVPAQSLKTAADVANAQSTVDLLRQMLEALDSGVQAGKDAHSSTENELVEELVSQCKGMQKVLPEELASGSDEAFLVRGLQLNEALQQALSLHERVQKKTKAAQSAAHQTAQLPPSEQLAGLDWTVPANPSPAVAPSNSTTTSLNNMPAVGISSAAAAAAPVPSRSVPLPLELFSEVKPDISIPANNTVGRSPLPSLNPNSNPNRVAVPKVAAAAAAAPGVEALMKEPAAMKTPAANSNTLLEGGDALARLSAQSLRSAAVKASLPQPPPLATLQGVEAALGGKVKEREDLSGPVAAGAPLVLSSLAGGAGAGAKVEAGTSGRTGGDEGKTPGTVSGAAAGAVGSGESGVEAEALVGSGPDAGASGGTFLCFLKPGLVEKAETGPGSGGMTGSGGGTESQRAEVVEGSKGAGAGAGKVNSAALPAKGEDGESTGGSIRSMDGMESVADGGGGVSEGGESAGTGAGMGQGKVSGVEKGSGAGTMGGEGAVGAVGAVASALAGSGLGQGLEVDNKNSGGLVGKEAMPASLAKAGLAPPLLALPKSLSVTLGRPLASPRALALAPLPPPGRDKGREKAFPPAASPAQELPENLFSNSRASKPKVGFSGKVAGEAPAAVTPLAEQVQVSVGPRSPKLGGTNSFTSPVSALAPGQTFSPLDPPQQPSSVLGAARSPFALAKSASFAVTPERLYTAKTPLPSRQAGLALTPSGASVGGSRGDARWQSGVPLQEPIVPEGDMAASKLNARQQALLFGGGVSRSLSTPPADFLAMAPVESPRLPPTPQPYAGAPGNPSPLALPSPLSLGSSHFGPLTFDRAMEAPRPAQAMHARYPSQSLPVAGSLTEKATYQQQLPQLLLPSPVQQMQTRVPVLQQQQVPQASQLQTMLAFYQQQQ